MVLGKIAGDLLKAKKGTIPPSPERLQCEANGGRWDGSKCIFPQRDVADQDNPLHPDFIPNPFDRARPGTIERTPEPPPAPGGIGAFPNPNDPNKTILAPTGDVAEDVTALIEKRRSKESRALAALQPLPLQQRQIEAAQAKRIEELTGKIGEVGPLTEAEIAKIDVGQAIGAGVANVIPAAAGGAAVGAAAGLVGSGGALSLPGAIALGGAGAVGGFASGVISNIKDQQKGEIGAAKVELTTARTAMRQLSMLASQDPANADIYIDLYNEQLTRVHQAQRQTKVETSGNLKTWGDDGRTDLANFDAFLRPGGLADIYGQKLKVSLQTDVPLTLADFEEDILE